jgi:WD40 repeat protein
LKYSKDKSIACVCWHPSQKGVLAVSCVQRSTFEERIQKGFSIRSKQSLALIWSFYDPIHPQLILEAAEDVSAFAFHPQQPHIIAGGCVNGQIVVWDISGTLYVCMWSMVFWWRFNFCFALRTEFQEKMKNKKREETEENKNVDVDIIKFIAVSSVEYSHRSAISDILWSPIEVNHNGEIIKKEGEDANASQLVSTGLDGNVMFWDIRYKKELKALDQNWRPTFKVPLLSLDCTFDYGLMKIAMDPNSSRIWCATEEGDVIQGDWLVDKQDSEKGASSKVEAVCGIHYAPVNDVLRSPFFPDILLSVGGWSCQIWQDKGTTPLISSAPSSTHYCCGAWSPTRPGVFFIGRSDGYVEIWDVLDR